MSTNGRNFRGLDALFEGAASHDRSLNEARLRQEEIGQYDDIAKETLNILEQTMRDVLGPTLDFLRRNRCYAVARRQAGGGEIMTVKGMSVPKGEVYYQAPKFTVNLWIPRDGFHPFAPFTPVRISLAEQTIFPTRQFVWEVQYKVRPRFSEAMPDLRVDTDLDLFHCPSGNAAMLEKVGELICERSQRIKRAMASRDGAAVRAGGPRAPQP